MALQPTVLSRGELRLRPVAPGDEGFILGARADADVVRFTDIRADLSADDAAAWVARRVQGWEQGWRASFVIEHSDQPSGYLNLRVDTGRSVGELGYWLLAAHRGAGVMSDAVRVVRDWSFDTLDLARLQATVQPENDASMRVLDRLGFTREGLLRSSDVLDGERHDHWMFSLLPSDPRR